MLHPGELREFLESGIIGAERMRAVDINAISLGLTSLQMMESAGKSLADAVLQESPASVLLLCGKGNNGGDGMVAARYLQHLADVSVIAVADGVPSESVQVQLRLLRSSAATVYPVQCREDVTALRHLFSRAGVIVDALLGIGANGTPREPVRSCVELANGSGVPIIAADVPTPGIRASRIRAFHRPKVEGSEVVDIGIPVEAECCVGPGDLTLVPVRAQDAHKGAGGTVVVIGGGPYQGAPYLSGLGALRAGADLVRVVSPVYMALPDIIAEPLDGDHIRMDHLERILQIVERSDVAVIGPGIGARSHEVVSAIAPYCRRAVYDADALRLPLPVSDTVVYTPHAGEFARITTGSKPPGDLVPRARTVKQAGIPGITLLKGRVDIISDGDRVRFNATGAPAMTVGGTGDVLAGVTGALLCNLPAFEAACIAAYVNGRAGMAAAEALGEGMIASDMVNYIPAELFRKGRSNG